MRRTLYWIVVIAIAVPLLWTAEKLLQIHARNLVQEDILASIRSEEIYTETFDLESPLLFGSYEIFGRGLAYSNIGETLERNELQKAIDRMDAVPFYANRPYDVYLRLEATRGGRPSISWFRGVLKACGGHPCPFEQQVFDETDPLPQSRTEFRQITREKNLTKIIFRYRVSYSVTVNNDGEIFGVSAYVSDRGINPIDRVLREVSQSRPPDYWKNVVSIFASYPRRYCRVHTEYSIFEVDCFR